MTTFHERNQRVTNGVGHIELLEITNASFSGPMRICNAAEDFVSQGLDYIGLPFGFKLPQDQSGAAPRMTLSLDNVGRGITDELEGLLPGSITIARLIVVARDTPDVHQHVFRLPLTAVTVSGATVQATCGVDALMRQAACKLIANPFTLPGIF